ncbi:phosphatidylglycerol lysyltransferase domain-containing protein [Lachnospiraceae bacterium ZAX-1]
MDLQFRNITLEDRELIDKYLAQKKYRGCESVFPNIYLWNRAYPTQFAIVLNTLVFKSENNGLSITFPAGNEQEVQAALPVMLDYFKERDKPFRMHFVQKPEFELLSQWYPNRFSIDYDRDAADYVYETELLTTLAGRKLHGKRNHANKFKELYTDWNYESITKQNVEECFQMGLKWREINGCETDPEKRDEMCVTLNALRLMEELKLAGGVLRVNGQVEAFTIGEPLDEETFVVHIEKAVSDIPGIYQMINQQFIAHEAQGFRYVNREEDTGSEGIRKAKLSYRPAFLVEKGTVNEIVATNANKE